VSHQRKGVLLVGSCAMTNLPQWAWLLDEVTEFLISIPIIIVQLKILIFPYIIFNDSNTTGTNGTIQLIIVKLKILIFPYIILSG
jgi:hypothetical protein